MKVNEVFCSIQGEGPDAGLPAVFVRLSGCNVQCRYCDTTYANNGKEMTLCSVIDEIKKLTRDNSVDHLIITGGEPLIQKVATGELVEYLHHDFKIAVETNGTQSIPSWCGAVMWDVDRKCPTSAVTIFNPQWYYLSKSQCRIKYVVSDEVDLTFVTQELKQFNVRPTILVSPVIESATTLDYIKRDWLQRVWQFCVDNNLRFSLQQHKVVWGNKKGV